MTLMRDYRVLFLLFGSFILFLNAGCSTGAAGPETVAHAESIHAAETDATVKSAMQTIERAPDSAAGYNELAMAYIRRARETGNFALNSKAEQAVDQALAKDKNDATARKLKASLQLTLHNFQEALEMGKRLQKDFPDDSFVWGVIVDAHTQLGNYDKAVDAAQRMVEAKPNSQSYARAAILRGLHGDTPGAAEMFKLSARTADPADREAQAWALTQLGDLYWRNGMFDDAEKAYTEALSILPEYPNAMFGKGRTLASKGDLNGGRSLIAGAVERSPHTYSIIYLADVYAKMGSPDAAARLYELANNEKALGDTHDAHRMALYWADRGENLDESLKIAEEDYAELKDVYAADILAWSLYKNGRYAEAKEKSREALRIGTKDAVLLYHAGMIENALGNKGEAKRLLSSALDLNPAFDLIQAPIAKTALAEIDSTR